MLRPTSCACGAATRKFGQVRQLRALRESDLDRVHHVGARPRADAGGLDGRQVDAHEVAEIVALPTTRVPS